MPGITYPRVPGPEVIGMVEAIGPDMLGWDVGTRVGVSVGSVCVRVLRPLPRPAADLPGLLARDAGNVFPARRVPPPRRCLRPGCRSVGSPAETTS